MDNNENKIEFALKNKISKINPSRSLFEQTMNQVTKDELNRNIIMKDEIPSINKISYMNFTKKIAYIGLPILALATYLVFINVNTNKDVKSPINLPVAQEDTVADNNPKVANNNVVEVTADSSVDAIVADIFSDIENDSALAINDATDSEFINAELDNYSSINVNGYEEIL